MPLRRTMLAETLDDSDLNDSLFDSGHTRFLIQPKYDGIRCQVYDGVAYSGRRGKVLPNLAVQSYMTRFKGTWHLDGELVVMSNGQMAPFHTTESELMSISGKPDFRYFVFDELGDPSAPYHTRLDLCYDVVSDRVFVTQSTGASCARSVREIENFYLDAGYEGVMLRLRHGRYKEGRSTLAEKLLLKRKPFTDDDAYIIGYEERYANLNEPTQDSNGLSHRSDHQENLVACGDLGAFVCYSSKWLAPFKVGTGFTSAERISLWRQRHALSGRRITFKYQKHGTKDKPRSPVFLRFRNID